MDNWTCDTNVPGKKQPKTALFNTDWSKALEAVSELDSEITLEILVDTALASHQSIYPLLQGIEQLSPGPPGTSSYTFF